MYPVSHTYLTQDTTSADGDHLQDARSQGCEDAAAVCESNQKEDATLYQEP